MFYVYQYWLFYWNLWNLKHWILHFVVGDLWLNGLLKERQVIFFQFGWVILQSIYLIWYLLMKWHVATENLSGVTWLHVQEVHNCSMVWERIISPSQFLDFPTEGK